MVGRSMGGGIAMLAALDQPARVASLTLVGTSPGGPELPQCLEIADDPSPAAREDAAAALAG